MGFRSRTGYRLALWGRSMFRSRKTGRELHTNNRKTEGASTEDGEGIGEGDLYCGSWRQMMRCSPEVNFSKWEVGLRWPLRCANQRAPQLNRFTSTSIHCSRSRQHFGYLDEWELFATRIHLGIGAVFRLISLISWFSPCRPRTIQLRCAVQSTQVRLGISIEIGLTAPYSM
jgi:hypothetical protein